MAKVKTIYFQDNIIEKLEKVENMSELINNLLKDYFEKNIGTENLKVKLNEFDKQTKRLMDEREKQRNSFVINLEDQNNVILKQEEKKFKEKQREEEINKNIRKNFEFFAKREMTEEEFDEYILIRDKINLIDFVDRIKKRRME